MTFLLRLLIFTCFSFSCACSLSAKVIIKGHFKGAPAMDRYTLRVSHQYLDAVADKYDVNTDENGTFTITAVVPEPQFVTLHHNDDALVLFVEPNDELEINSDIFQFPIGVTFGGRAAGNNTFLQTYLRNFPINFNEFSKLRFKIANYWCTLDPTMDEKMRQLKPAEFQSYSSELASKRFAFLDAYANSQPDALTPACKQFFSSEILYSQAYTMLVFGNVYKNWHGMTESAFDFLSEVPIESDMIGSDAYRQFLMAFMAHRFKKTGKELKPNVEQYLDADQILTGKARAFFQSEVIYNALKNEQYAEIMPYYTIFQQSNALDGYEEKITSVYEKAVAVSPGAVAPAFEGIDQGGKLIASNDLKGKILYLNFWAGYCGTCIKKMEYFNQQFSKLESAGVKIINISVDPSSDVWQANLARFNALGINLLNSTEKTTNIAKLYQVEAIPQYFIINKNGMFAQKPYTSKPEDIVNWLMQMSKQ